MNSKYLYVTVIITIMIVAVITGYLYFNEDENSSHNYYTEYHFELEMESENQTTVLWPIPYDAEDEWNEHYGNLSELVYDLEITKGDGSIEVGDTEKGRALKATFEGTVRIEGNKRIYRDQNGWNRYFFDELTMENKT